ncbi:MAG: RDD family protein [Myxococcota bacterium]|nr:RDD family protein [Myxococcota bacterium]
MRAGTGLLEGVHEVLTPEYVEFRYPLAGLYSRFLAWLVDAGIILLGFAAVMMVLAQVMAGFPGFLSALGFVLYFLLDWGYAMVLETWWSGQTVGKRLLGIRVIQESGVRLGFIQAALRNLARAVDRLPFLYLVGATTAVLSSSQQRLGDLLAGTIVVRDRRQKLPASLTRAPEEAQLLADPAFTSRLSQLSAEEQEVVLSAALRREELAMEARLKLFHALSEHLQSRGFYQPAHLSDEKLVLLVASGLARRGNAGRPSRRR